ncbi:MAG: hypothetical protein KatS3mg124_1144 [Porticoccaceae bacterium]|nr:MAG: hypothetical protein KatS3mg124_1144 [Porticoccaceae bacterium]
MVATRGPELEVSLVNYFRHRLAEASGEVRPRPQEDTLYYLANLLAQFGASDRFFARADDARRELKPLAFLYFEAQEARDERTRCLILRHLGDLALFLGALLPRFFARRGIRKEYFVGMGGGAYDYLAEHAASHQHVYAELASRFARFLELVAAACERETTFDASDVLDLYQRWVEYGDELALRQLRALGIEPFGGRRRH